MKRENVFLFQITWIRESAWGTKGKAHLQLIEATKWAQTIK